MSAMQAVSFVSTIGYIAGERCDAMQEGRWKDAAHYRNCEIALKHFCVVNDKQMWGVPICISSQEI